MIELAIPCGRNGLPILLSCNTRPSQSSPSRHRCEMYVPASELPADYDGPRHPMLIFDLRLESN